MTKEKEAMLDMMLENLKSINEALKLYGGYPLKNSCSLDVERAVDLTEECMLWLERERFGRREY